MAIWVGKQKMSCRSCIKGHRSSTCNHIGGPLWAVRPAGRPNKACIHGPGDLCLCAHYFPLTWLKAAVPRKQKCPCGSAHGHHSSSNSTSSSSSAKKCQCSGATAKSTVATSHDDETQPVFYQDLVARGLHVTTEPVDLDVASPISGSCCSAPAPAPAPTPLSAATQGGGSCCSNQQTGPVSPVQMPVTAPASVPQAAAPPSCCSGPAKIQTAASSPNISNNHPPRQQPRIKSESISTPFTPIRQFPTPPDFPVMRFSPLHPGGAVDHVCECGPTCNCVLCIDHPYNNATMNHIATEFGQMMSNGVHYSPIVANGHLNGVTNGNRPEFFPPGWPKGAGMMPATAAAAGFGESPFLQHQQSFSPPQQASDMDIILNPADFEMFNYAFPPVEGSDQQQEQEQNNSQLHLDTSLQMGLDSMPGLIDINGFCGGAPEGCPCGDDCACIGCQIHKPTVVNGFGSEMGLGLGIGDGTGPPDWN